MRPLSPQLTFSHNFFHCNSNCFVYNLFCYYIPILLWFTVHGTTRQLTVLVQYCGWWYTHFHTLGKVPFGLWFSCFLTICFAALSAAHVLYIKPVSDHLTAWYEHLIAPYIYNHFCISRTFCLLKYLSLTLHFIFFPKILGNIVIQI